MAKLNDMNTNDDLFDTIPNDYYDKQKEQGVQIVDSELTVDNFQRLCIRDWRISRPNSKLYFKMFPDDRSWPIWVIDEDGHHLNAFRSIKILKNYFPLTMDIFENVYEDEISKAIYKGALLEEINDSDLDILSTNDPEYKKHEEGVVVTDKNIVQTIFRDNDFYSDTNYINIKFNYDTSDYKYNNGKKVSSYWPLVILDIKEEVIVGCTPTYLNDIIVNNLSRFYDTDRNYARRMQKIIEQVISLYTEELTKWAREYHRRILEEIKDDDLEVMTNDDAKKYRDEHLKGIEIPLQRVIDTRFSGDIDRARKYGGDDLFEYPIYLTIIKNKNDVYYPWSLIYALSASEYKLLCTFQEGSYIFEQLLPEINEFESKYGPNPFSNSNTRAQYPNYSTFVQNYRNARGNLDLDPISNLDLDPISDITLLNEEISDDMIETNSYTVDDKEKYKQEHPEGLYVSIKTLRESYDVIFNGDWSDNAKVYLAPCFDGVWHWGFYSKSGSKIRRISQFQEGSMRFCKVADLINEYEEIFGVNPRANYEQRKYNCDGLIKIKNDPNDPNDTDIIDREDII